MNAGEQTSVAVVDIGSNSIKVLVATRAPDGGVTPLHQRTIDARISAGISQSSPRLGEDGMARGLEAIRALLAEIAPFKPARVELVATSAVRDAQNGAEFRARILHATGREIRILSGDEEADLIGRGLAADPALAGLRDFYVFDLGGGSLECLAFRNRHVTQAVSLQLGCVRLMEKFTRDTAAPFPDVLQTRIAAHVRSVFAQSAFEFDLPAGAIAVGTGGTMTTVRAIDGARAGKSLAATDPRLALSLLRELLACLAALPLAERREIPGLPPARADVFPTALATMIAVAELGNFSAFRHSISNLRYGLAAELLASPPPQTI
ncbi:MAG TPA: phosphatase [Opitutaceae bacterium]|nr:phosphatase [Opitutaceae bacterium]